VKWARRELASMAENGEFESFSPTDVSYLLELPLHWTRRNINRYKPAVPGELARLSKA
jgi:hypothetical protein